MKQLKHMSLQVKNLQQEIEQMEDDSQKKLRKFEETLACVVTLQLFFYAVL